MLGGLVNGWLAKSKSRKLKENAQEKVFAAFDDYSENCYKPEIAIQDENSSLTNDASNDSQLENRGNSKDEKIVIDVISNNADGTFMTLNGGGGFGFFWIR